MIDQLNKRNACGVRKEAPPFMFHFILVSLIKFNVSRKMIKLLLILIVSGISASDACSCTPVEKNATYCNSQFVGTINVYQAGQRCGAGNTCYVIKVVNLIRGSPAIILRTADNPADCGVTLVKGNTYFVAIDRVAAFYVGLYMCQLYEDWTGLSASEIETKTNEYLKIQC